MAGSNMQSRTFMIGFIIAIIAAFINLGSIVPILLFVLGLIVGFLNIEEKEVVMFLIAVIALVAVGSQSVSILSGYVGNFAETLRMIVGNIVVFVGAAALVVSLKAIIATGRD